MPQTEWLQPEWPRPVTVKAHSSTRLGGVSQAPYTGFNLGDHVEDNAAHVQANREQLMTDLALPGSPLWLQQVHSRVIVEANDWHAGVQADGCIARAPGQVCLVMTADCLPVLLANQAGTVVAAVHAGWRGLCDGILEQAVTQMACSDEITAWIGPAIGAGHFEVGDEVRSAFLQAQPSDSITSAFKPSRPGHWLTDLIHIAKYRLYCAGVRNIFGGHWCTYTDEQRFYSYRREGQTGRMASLIWLESKSNV